MDTHASPLVYKDLRKPNLPLLFSLECHMYVYFTALEGELNGLKCGSRNFTLADQRNADDSVIPMDPETSPQVSLRLICLFLSNHASLGIRLCRCDNVPGMRCYQEL